ncbi:hypothetical protein F5Y16DRAFT_254503 [Xylariaceae sp. FL0255]|nr:hypothetical protein F5Y16DRAFT_254503 [Xylariaceae sp. FL0255]
MGPVRLCTPQVAPWYLSLSLTFFPFCSTAALCLLRDALSRAISVASTMVTDVRAVYRLLLSTFLPLMKHIPSLVWLFEAPSELCRVPRGSAVTMRRRLAVAIEACGLCPMACDLLATPE